MRWRIKGVSRSSPAHNLTKILTTTITRQPRDRGNSDHAHESESVECTQKSNDAEGGTTIGEHEKCRVM
ncbi:hypothetical protein GJ744_005223 [Endocarpon pusillum]|uniref:Uncharacterized protein n=1 Tax=Endocarpon pusillum TaxID=364733 RepID=A0A8H7ACG4_9EURO|nr:hypothetical protein GJ744_005223 [Endocarpon pusillum]